jgi:hypothetical protein
MAKLASDIGSSIKAFIELNGQTSQEVEAAMATDSGKGGVLLLPNPPPWVCTNFNRVVEIVRMVQSKKRLYIFIYIYRCIKPERVIVRGGEDR